MAGVPNGWFVDPEDPTQERWWYGRGWGSATRPRRDGAVEYTGDAVGVPPDAASARPSSWLSTAGGWMYAIAVLSALGGIVGGIVLIAHGVPHCVPDAFDDTSLDCSSKIHPYRASGVAVIIGSLLQTAVIAVVGRLCFEVAAMRAERNSV